MPLNMSYSPRVVIDTNGLSEEDWKGFRRKGIGGSDVAAIFGVSPFRTMKDLYFDKTGVVPETPDESSWVAMEYGHRLEELVAKIFTYKTGLKTYADRNMYAHPLFPFMQANVDFFIRLPDGSKGILECKTTSFMNRDSWADGAVPYMYELQVRHYLAVMNLQTAYIACLYGNNDAQFVYQKIERDLDVEEDIIAREKAFWKGNVKANIPPPYVEETELVLRSIRKYLKAADRKAAGITLDASLKDNLSKYLELSGQKKILAAQTRKLEKEMHGLSIPVIEQMGPACKAACSDSGESYQVTYNPVYKTSITGENLMKLKESHPDIYEEYATTTESRRFSVEKEKAKEEEEAA